MKTKKDSIVFFWVRRVYDNWQWNKDQADRQFDSNGAKQALFVLYISSTLWCVPVFWIMGPPGGQGDVWYIKSTTFYSIPLGLRFAISVYRPQRWFIIVHKKKVLHLTLIYLLNYMKCLIIPPNTNVHIHKYIHAMWPSGRVAELIN